MKILKKTSTYLTKRDLLVLVDYFKSTRFLKSLKLKPHQLKNVVQQLHYMQIDAGKEVVKYGSKAENFYIIIEGSVSVWVPVDPADMIKPLQKFKQKIKSAVLATNTVEEIEFSFMIEPFAVENKLRTPYCTKTDFSYLCAKNMPQSMFDFTWRQFKLHRAVTTLAMVEKMLEETHQLKINSKANRNWEATVIDQIVENIQIKLTRVNVHR